MNINKMIKAQVKHEGKVLHIPGQYAPIDVAQNKPGYIRATLCLAAKCDPVKDGFEHKCTHCLLFYKEAFAQWKKEQLVTGGLNV